MSEPPSTAALPLDDVNHNGIFCFPKDLIPDILLRLPVKSLLRFRCVSKPWCSLIDSTDFVKKHLQRNIECNPDSGMVVKASQGGDLYLADVDPLCDITATEMVESLKTRVSGAEFVGSCNGLVCLYKDEGILLWNPATKKCRKLPKATNMLIPCMLIGSCVIGFGYDHVNDDYKVMRTYDSQIWGIMVNVYSLKSNSWTRADTIANEICIEGQFGAHVNGILYWLTDSDYIVAFDLGVGEHRILPRPVVDNTGMSGDGLIVFNRRLCLIAHYPDSRTDIWMMNDNGVENSWSKLLSMEHSGILGSINYMWPLAFSKTRNEFLLEVDGNKFKWYGPESNALKDATIHEFPDTFDSLVYTESLVPLSNDLKLDRKKPLKLAGKKKRQKQQQKKMMKEFTKGFKLKL